MNLSDTHFSICYAQSVRLQMAMKHFIALVGTVVDYYGADSAENTFKIDDIVFKAIEDPDDGYRSYLGSIDYTKDSNSIFFRKPLAKVKIESFDEENSKDYHEGYKGYRFIDVKDKHIWLEFGTAKYLDWYPMFVFRHRPKFAAMQMSEWQ